MDPGPVMGSGGLLLDRPTVYLSSVIELLENALSTSENRGGPRPMAAWATTRGVGPKFF